MRNTKPVRPAAVRQKAVSHREIGPYFLLQYNLWALKAPPKVLQLRGQDAVILEDEPYYTFANQLKAVMDKQNAISAWNALHADTNSVAWCMKQHNSLQQVQNWAQESYL